MEQRLTRGAGILLSISSLPSPYGIGTFGKEAYHFIDQLEQAGQSYWQVLPIEPTSYGDSPYQSFSTFAGNPYYIDLDTLVEEGLLEQEDNFAWWRRRIEAAARRYDVVRMDHFIGIVRYFAIPTDGVPADGEYHEGPGMKLIERIQESLGSSKMIAEDLGVIVPKVREVLKKSGYPGMKVLEFAFDGNSDNEYLPHRYEKNCVVYSGTHDNETLMGYFHTLSEEEFAFLCKYVDAKEKSDLAKRVIRLGYQSVADTVIIQMQDILEKDNSARMNLPSTIGHNWQWRMKKGEFSADAIGWLREMVQVYERLPQIEKSKEKRQL